ncbi:MAG: AAA family ATPase [Candidatus Kapaibacterium sp.]
MVSSQRTIDPIFKNFSNISAEHPFVGREKEVEKILQFYHAAMIQDGLSTLWIQGEAGIGKSRLLSVVAKELREKRVSVLHLRIYPDTASSLIGLIGRTIEMDTQLQPLLRSQIQGDLPSVMQGLRRITRLRAIVLIIEDLHLLIGEAANDFARLIAGLAEEELTVIAAARPQETLAYSILLPYQKDFLDLQGLEQKDTGILIEQLGIPAEEEVTERIQNLTFGNPLLIRSIVPFVSHETRNSTSPLQQGFFSNIKQGVQLSREAILNNYLADLSGEQRRGAELLALLGEVFSGETALTLHPASATLIPELLAKGVLCRHILPIGIISGKQQQDETFAFTHSLIHETLLGRTEEAMGELLNVLRPNVCLYSMRPLRQLLDIPNRHISPEVASQILDMFDDILYQNANYRHDWQTRKTLLEIAWQFFRKVSQLLDPEAEQNYRLLLSLYQITIWDIFPLAPEFQTPYNELSQLKVVTRQDALHRITFFGLSASYHLYLSTHYPAYDLEAVLREIFDELEEIQNQFSDIISTIEYQFMIVHLGSLLPTLPKDSPELIRGIEEYNRFLQVWEELGTETARRWILNTELAFLLVFRSSEELNERRQIADRAIAPITFGTSPRNLYHQTTPAILRFYSETGKVHEAWKVIRQLVHPMPTGARMSWECHLLNTYLKLLYMMGAPLETIEIILTEIVRRYNHLGIDFDRKHLSNIHRAITTVVEAIGLARNDLLWSERVVVEVMGTQASQLGRYLPMKAAIRQDRKMLRQLLLEERLPSLYIPFVSALDHVDESSWLELAERARQQIDAPILWTPDINRLVIFLHLFQLIRYGEQNLAEFIIEDVRRGITTALSWCADNSAPGLTAHFLDMAGIYLDNKEYSWWLQRIESLQKEISKMVEWNLFTPNPHRETLPRLSIIGQITLTLPDEEPRRLQGARIRQVLGMIVANQLLSKPLSLIDFRELATDREADPENAGNNLRVTVSRLRQMIGDKEVLVSDGENPPRLQLDRVRVDLLEAAMLLDRADEALYDHRPAKARQFTEQALQIVGNEPIYPTLYSDFFESARLEFELRMEQSIVRVAEQLREEGDIDETINFLYTVLQTRSTDEYLFEMLEQMLEQVGRKTEAIVLRKSSIRKQLEV